MSKLVNLQNALNTSTGKAMPETIRPTATPSLREIQKPPSKAASREGKKNIAAWLPSEFKKSIRLIQAKRPGDPSLEDLMAEAFNDLFIKYNVPTIREQKP